MCGPPAAPPMEIEYAEYATVEEVFLYMSAVAPPIKNTMPVTTYRGHVMSFIPLSPATGGSYLMVYAKADLAPGIYEFDASEGSYRAVTSIERTDRAYFVAVRPTRDTIADAALKGL